MLRRIAFYLVIHAHVMEVAVAALAKFVTPVPLYDNPPSCIFQGRSAEVCQEPARLWPLRRWQRGDAPRLLRGGADGQRDGAWDPAV